MEVAVCLPDEMLIQEGALRAHNLITPLLALQVAEPAPPPMAPPSDEILFAGDKPLLVVGVEVGECQLQICWSGPAGSPQVRP